MRSRINSLISASLSAISLENESLYLHASTSASPRDERLVNASLEQAISLESSLDLIQRAGQVNRGTHILVHNQLAFLGCEIDTTSLESAGGEIDLEALNRVTMEGLGSWISKQMTHYKEWRERNAQAYSLEKGEVRDAVSKLHELVKSLRPQVAAMAASEATVTLSGSMRKHFTRKGQLVSNITQAMHNEETFTTGLINKMIAKVSQTTKLVDDIADSIDVSSDEAFEKTCLNRLDSFNGMFLTDIIGNTEPLHLMGNWCILYYTIGKDFAAAKGVDKLAVLDSGGYWRWFEVLPADKEEVTKTFTKEELNKLLDCAERQLNMLSPERFRECDRLLKTLLEAQVRLYLIEIQRRPGSQYRNGLSSKYRHALRLIQILPCPSIYVMQAVSVMIRERIDAGLAMAQLVRRAVKT